LTTKQTLDVQQSKPPPDNTKVRTLPVPKLLEKTQYFVGFVVKAHALMIRGKLTTLFLPNMATPHNYYQHTAPATVHGATKKETKTLKQTPTTRKEGNHMTVNRFITLSCITTTLLGLFGVANYAHNNWPFYAAIVITLGSTLLLATQPHNKP